MDMYSGTSTQCKVSFNFIPLVYQYPNTYISNHETEPPGVESVNTGRAD